MTEMLFLVLYSHRGTVLGHLLSHKLLIYQQTVMSWKWCKMETWLLIGSKSYIVDDLE